MEQDCAASTRRRDLRPSDVRLRLNSGPPDRHGAADDGR